jgi:hypothetical protein
MPCACAPFQDGFAGTPVDNGAAEDVYEMVCLRWSGFLDSLSSQGTYRLNSKVQPREVSVNDLVHDLSDGVGTPSAIFSYRTILLIPVI